MQKLKVLISESNNPWINLAVENWIFRDLDCNQQVLFLWRNTDTVVIGRFQNPWTECNIEKMNTDNVYLARRQSGGGAVYQDLGNTNFTFLSNKNYYDVKTNNKIILNSLKEFSITASPSGRNDLTVIDGETKENRKFSGSAFKETKGRAFHHGTLLIDADLTKLADYLNPNKKKLMSKGIKSVRSRVTNLKLQNNVINHDDLCESIINNFCLEYKGRCEIEYINEDILKQNKKIEKYYLDLSDWNWRFGETPQFNYHLTERFSWGEMDVYFDVHKAVIKKVVIYSDSLHPEMIEMLVEGLTDELYTANDIELKINQIITQLPMISDYLTEFKNWIVNKID